MVAKTKIGATFTQMLVNCPEVLHAYGTCVSKQERLQQHACQREFINVQNCFKKLANGRKK